MGKKGIVGLIILVVIVSVCVYEYMDYQEKERQRRAYEAWLQEMEAKQQAWDEEVAYYENLSRYPIPDVWMHDGSRLHFVINEPYEYGRWGLYLEYYGEYDPISDPWGITEIRNVTRMELRDIVNTWLNPDSIGGVRINIDGSEGVIFIMRSYREAWGVEPFNGSILVCWRP